MCHNLRCMNFLYDRMSINITELYYGNSSVRCAFDINLNIDILNSI